MTRYVAVLAVALATVGTAQGGIINFEGFSDGDQVTSVITGDNIVSFVDAVGPNPGMNSLFNAVQVGRPAGGFARDDIPAPPGALGRIFLSDEFGTPSNNLSPDGAYGMSFALGITSLTLDVADYRADGGGRVGDRVRLRLFASDDLTGPAIGEDLFVINNDPAQFPDGVVKSLSVTLQGGLIARSASVMNADHSDVGTGIDNIEFDSVPEPSTLAIWGAALGLAGLQRRRRNRR